MAGVIVPEDAGPALPAADSVNSVKGFERIAKLFCDLRAAGVDARPTPEGIELKGSTAGLTAELLDRLRADRDGLLALLEQFEERRAIAEADGELSPQDAERLALAEVLAERSTADGDAARELAGAASGREADPPGAFRCPWCGPVELREDPEGMRCCRCDRLAWVLVGRSIVRADCVGDDLEGLAPDDVPACPSCGRWCDVEPIKGPWRCSRCDPEAETRRRRTLRIRESVELLRRGR